MRKATKEDESAILAAMWQWAAVSTAPHVKHMSERAVMLSVHEAIESGRMWMFGGYAVMVDYGSDWFTEKTFLIEQIVIKVHREDKSWNLQTVLHAGLDQLASHYGCEAVVAGDTQIGYMTPLYIAAGYVPLGTQLFKESPNGIRKEGHS